MSSSPIATEVASIPTPWGTLHARRWFPERPDPRQPVIVLFHDSLGCVELWRDFPEQLCLRSGLEVVAYDRLGFGRSTRHPGPLPLGFIGDEADSVFPLLRKAMGIERKRELASAYLAQGGKGNSYSPQTVTFSDVIERTGYTAWLRRTVAEKLATNKAI